jgi:hypothetical protein
VAGGSARRGPSAQKYLDQFHPGDAIVAEHAGFCGEQWPRGVWGLPTTPLLRRYTAGAIG